MKTFDDYLKIISEELLFRMTKNNVIIEFYKNPRTLKNLGEWCRGIIDVKTGDLYIWDFDPIFLKDKGGSMVFAIHAYGARMLNQKNIIKNNYGEGDDPADFISSLITVDREGKSNTFIPAESYLPEDIEEFEEEFEAAFDKAKRKNPQFNFEIYSFNLRNEQI